jgi:hypothetical protein
MVIGATAPFVTAAMTWLWLGRRESATTLAASVVALAGVAVMFNAGMSAAHLPGSLLALAMTVLMSGMMVIIRHKRDTPMLPAASLSAFLCAALVLPVAAPGRVGWHDLMWLAVFGMAQFGLGLLLMTLGTGMISATRSALICTLDTPLAPVWVWLAVGERPSLPTCIGGAIVMAAVLADIVLRKPPSALSLSYSHIPRERDFPPQPCWGGAPKGRRGAHGVSVTRSSLHYMDHVGSPSGLRPAPASAKLTPYPQLSLGETTLAATMCESDSALSAEDRPGPQSPTDASAARH